MTRVQEPTRDAPASEWNVFADALQEAGDPRGELIILAQTGMTAERDAHVAKHRAALFGPAAEYAGAYRVTWRYCLADAVEIVIEPNANAVAIVQAFLESPLAPGARSIALVGVPDITAREPLDLAESVALLLARLPAATRCLAFVDQRATQTTMLSSRDFEPDANRVQFGSLAAVWSVPNLEELRLEVADSGQLVLGTIAAPTLRAFTLRSLCFGDDDSSLAATLGAAEWPALRSFELRLPEVFFANVTDDEHAYVPQYFGSEDWADRQDEAEPGESNGTDWSSLRPLLDHLKAAPLERLALTSFETTASLLDVVASAGLAPTLVELDFSDSSIAQPTWFATNRRLLAGLKTLRLERTALDDAAIASLRALGPEVIASGGGGATYRYVVGSE